MSTIIQPRADQPHQTTLNHIKNTYLVEIRLRFHIISNHTSKMGSVY